jgi:hypothetical protein
MLFVESGLETLHVAIGSLTAGEMNGRTSCAYKKSGELSALTWRLPLHLVKDKSNASFWKMMEKQCVFTSRKKATHK